MSNFLGLIGLNLILVVIYMILALMWCFISSSWVMINPVNWGIHIKIIVCIINTILTVMYISTRFEGY
jgi:uncharacterized membrane protein (DUF485 family)